MDENTFKLACKRNNAKVNTQRKSIFNQIIKLAGHPSIEDIYESIKKDFPKLSMDTVYRNVSAFEKWGIVRKVSVAGNASCYEVNTKEHQHFYCRKCKSLIDFDFSFINLMLKSSQVKSIGKIEMADLMIYGICNNCQKN